MFVANFVDSISDKIAKKTAKFVRTKIGKFFMGIVILGPLTFLPTVWAAWTASNIDSLRTWTWPLMIIINASNLLCVIHNGDWRLRLVMFLWILVVVAVFIATLVR